MFDCGDLLVVNGLKPTVLADEATKAIASSYLSLG
jgi:hypothetical protein